MSESSAPESLDSATLAVTSHALLNSVAVAQGAAETLHVSWDHVSEDDRRMLMAGIVKHLGFVADLLSDLVRAVPLEVRAALSDLDAQRPAR
jgi:K+-sensing histidine kinase KdpD